MCARLTLSKCPECSRKIHLGTSAFSHNPFPTPLCSGEARVVSPGWPPIYFSPQRAAHRLIWKVNCLLKIFLIQSSHKLTSQKRETFCH